QSTLCPGSRIVTSLDRARGTMAATLVVYSREASSTSRSQKREGHSQPSRFICTCGLGARRIAKLPGGRPSNAHPSCHARSNRPTPNDSRGGCFLERSFDGCL